MPLYDFTCAKCGKSVEALQAIDAAAPGCCGQPMERGFGSLSVWYWINPPPKQIAPMVNSKALATHYSREWARLYT